MDKTAVAHWAPEIGGQFWWNGVFFVLIFVPFMLFMGKKLSSKQRDMVLYGMGIYQLGNKIFTQIGYIFSDNYILASNLPLHLCGLSFYLHQKVLHQQHVFLLLKQKNLLSTPNQLLLYS